MLSAFLLTIHSLKLTIPVVTLFGSAPTFFTFWIFIRIMTSFSSREIYRISDDYLYSIYQRFVLFFFENWVNVKIYLHGDFEKIFEKKENILYLSNHQSSVDWIIANILAIRQGSLGHIRYVLKDDLKWIPFYGFYFQQHGCIYVKRNDKRDLQRIENGMKEILFNGLPIWLIIFPEGTRFNPISNQFALERSKQFAQEKGLLPFHRVLYPRSGATIAAIKVLKHQLDAVYDVTIMYNQTYDSENDVHLAAPSMFEYVQDQINQLHIHIKRIEINEIPSETNEQISDWLYQRFIIKDKLLKSFDNFQRNKNIEGLKFLCDENDRPMEIELPLRETIYSTLLFLLTTISLLSTQRGRSFYWKMSLIATPITLIWMHLFPSSSRFH